MYLRWLYTGPNANARDGAGQQLTRAPEHGMAKPKNERVVMSVIEAGKKLGIGKDQAYALAHAGKLPVLHLGKRRMAVPIAAFERMLETAGNPKAA
jgi:excisionase family DNA binding protein